VSKSLFTSGAANGLCAFLVEQLVHSEAMPSGQCLTTLITNKSLDLVMNSPDVIGEIIASNKPLATVITAILSDVEMNNISVFL
jgi:hypothetical protein